MKIAKLIILLVPLFFIAQCAQFGGLGGQGARAGQGITVDFLKNQPPTDKLYENQNFRVGLELKNYGLKDTRAYVCVYDTIADFFGGIPSNICEQVQINAAEKSGANIIPEVKDVYFPTESQTYSYRQIAKGMSTNIITDVIYPYETKANAQLCLKKDENIKTTGVTCELSSTEPVIQDPAPIVVSNLKKDIIPGVGNEITLLVTFDLQNTYGEILDKNKISQSITDEDRVIDVNLNLKGMTSSFTCNPNKDGKILFKENQKTLKCEAIINLNQDYIVNPLEITVGYAHKISKSTGAITLVSKEEA